MKLTLDGFRISLICVDLVIACVLGLSTIELVRTANRVTAAVPALIDARAARIEADLSGQITASLGIVDRQVTAARADAVGQIAATRSAVTGQLVGVLDSRLGSIQKDVNGQASTLNATLTQTLKPMAAIEENTAKASEDLPGLVRDSRFFMARAARTAGHVEQMADTIEHETPKMTANADLIASSSVAVASSAAATGNEVAIAAKRFNAPQTKWQQFRMWTLAVARVVGAL
jgi:hypothetical protein